MHLLNLPFRVYFHGFLVNAFTARKRNCIVQAWCAFSLSICAHAPLSFFIGSCTMMPWGHARPNWWLGRGVLHPVQKCLGGGTSIPPVCWFWQTWKQHLSIYEKSSQRNSNSGNMVVMLCLPFTVCTQDGSPSGHNVWNTLVAAVTVC